MPLEIKQLVIKSKTINDDNKNAPIDADRSNDDAEESLTEKTLPYHFMTSPDTARER